MGIERYVEKMCLANPHLKENNLISKWKLAQPNREKSPELERLLRERFQEGHHRNAFTPRARQHAGGGQGGSALSRNGSAHHPDMHRDRTGVRRVSKPAWQQARDARRNSQRNRKGYTPYYGWYADSDVVGPPRPNPDPTPGQKLAKLGGVVGVGGGVGLLGRSIYHSETTCPNCGERAPPASAVRCSLAHTDSVALQAPPAGTATITSKPPLWNA